MQAAIEAAKQAFLANGGKITKLEGFESVEPLPAAIVPKRKPKVKPAAVKKVDRRLSTAETVGRAYIAEAVGMTVKWLFLDKSCPYRKFLPTEYNGGSNITRYKRTEADAAIKAIKAERGKLPRQRPVPLAFDVQPGWVDREYITERLDVSRSHLWSIRYPFRDLLPMPVAGVKQGRAGRAKEYFSQEDADAAIVKIKAAVAERERGRAERRPK